MLPEQAPDPVLSRLQPCLVEAKSISLDFPRIGPILPKDRTIMFDAISIWSRLMNSGLMMTQTGLRTMEMLVAANKVFTARMDMMGGGMGAQPNADRAELARMLPEKVDAFSRAGSAAVATWWTAQSNWTGHFQHLGGMAMSGRLPTPVEMANLGERMVALTLEQFEAQARVGAVALAPVHRKVISNARRLRRRSR